MSFSKLLNATLCATHGQCTLSYIRAALDLLASCLKHCDTLGRQSGKLSYCKGLRTLMTLLGLSDRHKGLETLMAPLGLSGLL